MLELEHDLLAAERRGRAITLMQNPEAGSSWRITALDDPDGHALLAAARLGTRLGASTRVALAAPERPSALWTLLTESCRRQGLIDASAKPATENRLFSFNPHGGEYDLHPGQFPNAAMAWCFTLGQSALFVEEVPPDAPALSCAQCRAIDKTAIETLGVPGLCLMENAAIGAIAVAMDMLHSRRGSTLILAGGGNNGGDGLAMARGMWELGLMCEVVLARAPDALIGDAAVNLGLLKSGTGVPIHEAAGNPEGLSALLEKPVLVIDGLLGTGFKGGLSSDYAAFIHRVNQAAKPVLALDIPSGLHGDTGEVFEAAILCQRTVTFAAVKTGLRQAQGPRLSGKLYRADIGAPLAAYA